VLRTVKVPPEYCVDPGCDGVPMSAAVHGAGGAVVPVTVIVRAADDIEAPSLSVAIAVNEYEPGGTLLHVTLYGEAASDPINVVPAKKSTFAIVPSGSDAVASTVIVAGAANVAPAAGLVSDTDGVWLLATVIVRAPDVLVAPRLSVATARSEYVPTGTLLHVTL
jgi:hypothetical protein